jgi:hypothetical protein
MLNKQTKLKIFLEKAVALNDRDNELSASGNEKSEEEIFALQSEIPKERTMSEKSE